MQRWRRRLRKNTWLFHSPALLFLWLMPPAAVAQVNPWARAKDPQLTARQALLTQADRARLPRGELFDGGDVLNDTLLQKLGERSAIVLELAGLRASADPEAAYLLAECWASAGAEAAERAETALKRALELAPEHAHAAAAWHWLALVRLRAGQFDAVSAAVQQSLLLEANPQSRAQLYVLAGYAELLGERLSHARQWFEFGLTEAPGSAEWALSSWGLGLLRDLERDAAGALEQVLLAGRWEGNEEGQRALETPLGELLPLSLRAYLRGLLLLAQAERGEPNLRVSRLSAAQLMFLTYREAAVGGVALERAQQHIKELGKQLQLKLSDDLDREALRPMNLNLDE